MKINQDNLDKELGFVSSKQLTRSFRVGIKVCWEDRREAVLGRVEK